MASLNANSITSRRNKLANKNAKKDSIKEYKAVSPLDEQLNDTKENELLSDENKERLISESQENKSPIATSDLAEANTISNISESITVPDLKETPITEKIEEESAEVIASQPETISEPIDDILVPLLTAENASSMIQKALQDVIQKERKKQLDKEDPVTNKGFYIRKSIWTEVKKYCLMNDITYSAFANDAFAEKLARDKMES